MNPVIDSDLEEQYNNRKAVPDFADYLKDWENRSKNFRETANALLDVSYGESERETLDIFFCKNPDAALHIFIHGGYWQALSKDAFSFMAEAFNERSENAIILNYDLCPQVTVGHISRQMKKAINWLFSDDAPSSLNKNRIQITGHSAGGHLVAELLTVSDFSAEVPEKPFVRTTSLSGLFDLEPLIKTTINVALELNDDNARLYSPIHKMPVNPESVELDLIVGSLESTGYHQQSASLEQQWKNSGLKITRLTAPKVHHFSVLDSFINDYYRPIS